MKNKDCSEHRACRLFRVSRTSYRYKALVSTDSQDKEITKLLLQLAHAHKRWGFGLMFRWLRKKGYYWNHKRVYRV